MGAASKPPMAWCRTSLRTTHTEDGFAPFDQSTNTMALVNAIIRDGIGTFQRPRMSACQPRAAQSASAVEPDCRARCATKMLPAFLPTTMWQPLNGRPHCVAPMSLVGRAAPAPAVRSEFVAAQISTNGSIPDRWVASGRWFASLRPFAGP